MAAGNIDLNVAVRGQQQLQSTSTTDAYSYLGAIIVLH